MTLRLPLALVGLLTLSACDSGAGSDDITGTWSTTIDYSADTLLAEQNYRIVADYAATYTFELVHGDGDIGDGLIYGRITSSLDGLLTSQEAGRDPVVYTLNGEETVTDYVFGTYDDPALELDVPWGRYSDNLWTFEKVGGRAELGGQVVHEWAFETLFAASPGTFTYIIEGDGKKQTSIRRTDTTRPVVDTPVVTTGPGAELVYEDERGNATLSRVRVETR